jgi:hypothetical protein
MKEVFSRNKDLKIGDLITHILYGKEWIGVIISFYEEKNKKRMLHSEQALVQMQPNTKFHDFFKRNVSEKNRKNDSLGLVSTSWLFRL